MSKAENRSMLWIVVFEDNNFHKLQDDENYYYTDYEVCSELYISGYLDYEDGNMYCRMLSEKNKDGLYTYLIRIKKYYKLLERFNKNDYAKFGYYFDGGVLGELLSIFSVFFQARFFLESTTGPVSPVIGSGCIFQKHINNYAYTRIFSKDHIEMIEGQSKNWNDSNGIQKFLDTIKQIDHIYHQRIIQSFSRYAKAVQEIGRDKELFYIKMVSSIESLLGEIAVPYDNLDNHLNELSKKQSLNPKEKDVIKERINTRGVKKRFVAFLVLYSKGFFKGGFKKAAHCFIKKSQLEEFAKQIYNARSAYLHEGKPMYISEDRYRSKKTSRTAYKRDIFPSGGTFVDRRKIVGKEKLPRVRWFERITNYCLRKYIEDRFTKG